MKQLRNWLLPLLSVGLTCAVAAYAAEKPPSTQPSDDSKPAKSDKGDKEMKPSGKGGRWGFAPYNQLSGLTDEQKMKIGEIHRKANAERKVIDDKEESDVMALLTDEQKVELDKMRAEKKAKQAEKRTSGKSKDKGDDDAKDEKDK